MIKIIQVMLFLATSSVMATGLTPQELETLFFQGNDFFSQGNTTMTEDPKAASDLYQKAILRFERIVREGNIQNGQLYYNIANSYFRLGDIGKAILNYKKAALYIPNDINLNQNLAHARQQRIDKIEEKPETQVLKTVLFWHYDFSTQIRSTLFILCFILFWAALSIKIFFPQKIPRWTMLCCAAISLLFFASLMVDALDDKHNTGVILAKEVMARKGDGENYQPSFKDPLHSGTEFRLIENRNLWYLIELHDGQQCWIPENSAGLV